MSSLINGNKGCYRWKNKSTWSTVSNGTSDVAIYSHGGDDDFQFKDEGEGEDDDDDDSDTPADADACYCPPYIQI